MTGDTKPRKARGSRGRKPEDLPAKLRIAFGTKLRETRLAAGITQAELSEATAVNQGYISQIEAGALNISIETMAKLATALGLDMDILLAPRARPPGKK